MGLYKDVLKMLYNDIFLLLYREKWDLFCEYRKK